MNFLDFIFQKSLWTLVSPLMVFSTGGWGDDDDDDDDDGDGDDDGTGGSTDETDPQPGGWY